MRRTIARPRADGRLRRALITSVLIASLWGAGATHSDAKVAGSAYSGVADARLVAINITAAPAVVFDKLVDAGGAVAQAELDSLGTSTAFASDPYPSEVVVLLPGLTAGLTEGATSDVIPEYPLIASSSYPTQQDDEVAAPPLVLRARSRSASSRASATNGLGHGEATVEFDQSDEEVIVQARASAGVIALTDLVSISSVSSSATARKGPTGKLQLDSTFEAGDLTIAGQVMSLQQLLGNSDDLSNAASRLLLGQLAAQGLDLEIIPETRTDDSITSAGLRIRWTQETPDMPPAPALPELDLPPIPGLPTILALPGGVSGIETVTTEMVIGQTTARVDSRALPTLDSAPEVSSPPIPSTDAFSTDDAGPATSTGITNPGPEKGTGSGSTKAWEDGGARTSSAATITRTTVPADISLAQLYPVLLLAGLACVVTSILIGKLGVQTTWT